ncbi:MAG TPA: hypothetical protein VGY55_20730 [Pirellulales bacterium]|jgi:hypothetical protein|nr:hypothetical protein [Pirellulales bacterium]
MLKFKPSVAIGLIVLLAGAARADDAFKPDDDGFIRNWLVLAPIPNGENVSGTDALGKEFISGEANLKPKADEKAKIGDLELTWKPIDAGDHVINFNAILGQQTEDSTAYAVAYLVADDEMKDLNLKMGSDDQAKVYLNGKEVLKNETARPVDKDQDTANNITLNKGTNVVVFKIVNEKIDWGGCMRFTDKSDNAVKNLTVKLTP